MIKNGFGQSDHQTLKLSVSHEWIDGNELTFFMLVHINIFVLCSCANPIFSGSWDVDQNAPSQSDCRIFKSIISPEQIDETASLFECWYKFTKIKSWSSFFIRHGQSCLWTLNLTVSQEWTDEINWFFANYYKFTQLKRWLKIFWVCMVKNGWGQSGLVTDLLNGLYLKNE